MSTCLSVEKLIEEPAQEEAELIDEDAKQEVVASSREIKKAKFIQH